MKLKMLDVVVTDRNYSRQSRPRFWGWILQSCYIFIKKKGGRKMGNRGSLSYCFEGCFFIRFVFLFDYLQCLVGGTSPPKTVPFTLRAFPTSTPIPRTALGSSRCRWATESTSTSLCCRRSPTTTSSPSGGYRTG